MPEKFYKIFPLHIIVTSSLNTSIFTVPRSCRRKSKMCQRAKTKIIRKIFWYGRWLWKERLQEWESQERTGRTAAYRNKSRKRSKIESNRGASTDLRGTRIHEDAPAVGICFYYKVCKCGVRGTPPGFWYAVHVLAFLFSSYSDTIINCIVKRDSSSVWRFWNSAKSF